MKKLWEVLKAARTRRIGVLILILAFIVASVIWHKNFINDQSTDKEIFVHQSIEHFTGGLILCDHCSIEKESGSFTVKTRVSSYSEVPTSYWEDGILTERTFQED
jgi:hypothetical protein